MAQASIQSAAAFPVACFAPPLSDEKLARYRALANEPGDALTREQREAFAELLLCVEKWWNLPESTRRDGRKFRVKHRGTEIDVQETPLTADLVKELWDVTPYARELKTLTNEAASGLFDSLPAGELRDAAMHLVWHAMELTLDREPLTQDKLPAGK